MTAPHVALRPAVAERLLEELIYERMRAHVDLLELGWLEADLDMSIRRVLAEIDRDGASGYVGADPDDADTDGAEAPSAVLAAALMERAWARIEAEWEHRSADDDDECPICLRSEAAL